VLFVFFVVPFRAPSPKRMTRDNRVPIAYIAPNIVRWRWMALTSGGSERASRFFLGWSEAKLARQDR